MGDRRTLAAPDARLQHVPLMEDHPRRPDRGVDRSEHPGQRRAFATAMTVSDTRTGTGLVRPCLLEGVASLCLMSPRPLVTIARSSLSGAKAVTQTLPRGVACYRRSPNGCPSGVGPQVGRRSAEAPFGMLNPPTFVVGGLRPARCSGWWAAQDLNLRPLACEARAGRCCPYHLVPPTSFWTRFWMGTVLRVPLHPNPIVVKLWSGCGAAAPHR
jgi:hypothetical protein